jgi:hypothetical protein
MGIEQWAGPGSASNLRRRIPSIVNASSVNAAS